MCLSLCPFGFKNTSHFAESNSLYRGNKKRMPLTLTITTCLITFICSHCHGKTKQKFSINTEWIKDPHIKCVIVLFLKMIGCSLILKSTQKHSTYIPCQTILWVINTLKKIVHKYKTHPQIHYVKLARKQMALTQHWTGITCCIFFTNLQYNIPQFHLLFSDLILGSLCSDNFNSWKILFTIHE